MKRTPSASSTLLSFGAFPAPTAVLHAAHFVVHHLPSTHRRCSASRVACDTALLDVDAEGGHTCASEGEAGSGWKGRCVEHWGSGRPESPDLRRVRCTDLRLHPMEGAYLSVRASRAPATSHKLGAAVRQRLRVDSAYYAAVLDWVWRKMGRASEADTGKEDVKENPLAPRLAEIQVHAPRIPIHSPQPTPESPPRARDPHGATAKRHLG